MAFSSNALHLASSRTGKVLHRIDCSDFSNSPICCVGWGSTLADSTIAEDHVGKLNPSGNINDVAQAFPLDVDLPPDLPRALSSLRVESFLPKLSPLSSGGMEYDEM